MLAQRTQIALQARNSDPSGMAQAPTLSTPMAEVKKLMVQLYREHLVRAKSNCIEMDERSFLAHYQYVRGWSEADRVAKWAEIKNEPARFRTSMGRGHLTVWVPQNKEIAIEEIIGTRTSEAARTMSLTASAAHDMLLGQGGGVTPGANAAAALGGPITLDSSFDTLFQSAPVAAASTQVAPTYRPRFARSGTLSDISHASSPGPSASAVAAALGNSDSESAVQHGSSSVPKSLDAPASVGQEPRGIKRVHEDCDSDKESAVSTNTKKTKGSLSTKAKPRPPVTLDWGEFDDTITNPLLFSSLKHLITDFIEKDIENFQVCLGSGIGVCIQKKKYI